MRLLLDVVKFLAVRLNQRLTFNAHSDSHTHTHTHVDLYIYLCFLSIHLQSYQVLLDLIFSLHMKASHGLCVWALKIQYER